MKRLIIVPFVILTLLSSAQTDTIKLKCSCSSGTIDTTTTPPAYTPETVSGLRAWFRADTGVTVSGSNVTTWYNAAPLPNVGNLTASSTARPTLGTNSKGYASINFDGITNTMVTPNPTASSVFTCYIVYEIIGTGNGFLITNEASANGVYAFINGSTPTLQWAGTNVAAPFAFGLTGFKSYSGGRDVYRNGVLLQHLSGNLVSFAPLRVAARNGATDAFLKVRISEIVLYDNEVEAEDDAAVVAYLKNKYHL
jgi:hypothetical protein